MKGNNILDILIPVFNEDETIVKTIENIFSAVKYDYKIIICYDYDEDPTLKIIKESFPHNSKIVFVKVALRKPFLFLWRTITLIII